METLLILKSIFKVYVKHTVYIYMNVINVHCRKFVNPENRANKYNPNIQR